MNNIESYPHDNNLHLFKKDFLNKINMASIELLRKLELDEGKEVVFNSIKELTVNELRELILAAIDR